ncbi:TetR/AcrR family transcriptional regulator [Anaerotignum sp.]|uniref:TetR/AcrR family transcriptional regulator n=1 Tax=Anaerotignum sp. TaxID=2039241 RepID=UPI002A920E6B|nr:TetR/AcrR family transcriptional regulator [Anaerotignum sp.]MCI7658483.1 TetR/AcrR family transcriptional regulator [Clostridia bacterium]MDY5414273.1 TetR/AcrR family transcriptional regulator [Anaerotignum sp.]
MHPNVTSKEKLLLAAKELAKTEGLSALQMRSLASAAGVAVGSVYNYFPNKNALLTAVVASIWFDMFHNDPEENTRNTGFCDTVSHAFSQIQKGIAAYPDFFAAHRVIFNEGEKENALKLRESTFSHMAKNLLSALEADPRVRPDVFDGSLTKTALISFTFTHLLALWNSGAKDCDTLTTILSKLLYGDQEVRP